MPASGIRGTHDILLGSHLCLFYRRPQEFLHVTAAFLKAGVINHELCVWVLPPPVTIPLALEELSSLGLNGPALQASRQLQLESAHDWYSYGTFDVKGSLERLAALPTLSHQLGYGSVRGAAGPGQFPSEECRQSIMRYERQATAVIAQLPIIGLCCYASSVCLETDMFDIMSAHPKALLRTHSGWFRI